jgi:tetratricopeptide (TPR) repeat protein
MLRSMKVCLRTPALVIFVLLVLANRSASQSVEKDNRIQQLHAEAKAEEALGNLENAVQKYLGILQLDPKLPAAHNNLGKLYFQQARFSEAIKTLKRACELDPDLAAPRALRGLSFYQMGDFVTARQELQTALKLNPSDRNAKLFLARSLIELEDRTGALKLLLELQQDDPRNAEVLFTLGSLYSSLAETTLGAIQTVDPNSYLIEVLLARYAELKQVYADAIEHYQRAIQKAPDVSDLYYRYAHALWASGDFQKALTEFRRALTVNPYDYRASWEAARILLSDNPEEAFRLSNRALELKNDIPGALAIRGRALLALRRPKEALEDFKRATALNPEDATIHYQLARAYRQLGQLEEAAKETAIHERMQKEAHTPKEEKTSPPH